MTNLSSGRTRALRRGRLFDDRKNAAATIVLAVGLACIAIWFARWAIVNAIWICPSTAVPQCVAWPGQTERAGQ